MITALGVILLVLGMFLIWQGREAPVWLVVGILAIIFGLFLLVFGLNDNDTEAAGSPPSVTLFRPDDRPERLAPKPEMVSGCVGVYDRRTNPNHVYWYSCDGTGYFNSVIHCKPSALSSTIVRYYKKWWLSGTNIGVSHWCGSSYPYLSFAEKWYSTT
jgi:hypothetical protein